MNLVMGLFSLIFALVACFLSVNGRTDCSILEFLSPIKTMTSDASTSETEKFSRVFQLLTKKGALDDDALGRLARSATPINPMDLAIVPGRLSIVETSVFKSAFAMILSQSQPKGTLDWNVIQKETRRILQSRTSQDETREVTSKDTKKIFQPVILKNAITEARYGRVDFFDLQSGKPVFLTKEVGGEEIFQFVNGLTGEARSVGLPHSEMTAVFETKDGRTIIAVNFGGTISFIDTADMKVFGTLNLNNLPKETRLVHGNGRVSLFEGERGLGVIVSWEHTGRPDWLRVDLKTKEFSRISIAGGDHGYAGYLTKDGRILKFSNPARKYDSISVSDYSDGVEKPLLNIPYSSDQVHGKYRIKDYGSAGVWVEIALNGEGDTVELFNVSSGKRYRAMFPAPGPQPGLQMEEGSIHLRSDGRPHYLMMLKAIGSSGEVQTKLWDFDLERGTSRSFEMPELHMSLIKVFETKPGETVALLVDDQSAFGQKFEKFFILNFEDRNLTRYPFDGIEVSSRRHYYQSPDGRIVVHMSDKHGYLVPVQLFGPATEPGKDP
jgi:hypothetical protein